MHETQIYVGAASTHYESSWGAILISGPTSREIRGSLSGGTPNRAKLQATVSAISMLRGRHQIRLFTDLQYIARGINEWLPDWSRSGLDGIKNSDLWAILSVMLPTYDIQAVWVPGFSGTPLGQRANQVAQGAPRQTVQGIL